MERLNTYKCKALDEHLLRRRATPLECNSKMYGPLIKRWWRTQNSNRLNTPTTWDENFHIEARGEDPGVVIFLMAMVVFTITL